MRAYLSIWLRRYACSCLKIFSDRLACSFLRGLECVPRSFLPRCKHRCKYLPLTILQPNTRGTFQGAVPGIQVHSTYYLRRSIRYASISDNLYLPYPSHSLPTLVYCSALINVSALKVVVDPLLWFPSRALLGSLPPFLPSPFTISYRDH